MSGGGERLWRKQGGLVHRIRGGEGVNPNNADMGDASGKDKDVMERAWNQAAGNLVWPMLTRTNYQEWSALV